MNLRQLLILKEGGTSNRSSALILQVHRNTVNPYTRLFKASGQSYKELLELSDKDLMDLFPEPGRLDYDRYEELSGYFSYFKKQLHLPGATREHLWKEYLLKHPLGYSYTQFNEHYNQWLQRVNSSGKLNHIVGDKMYVDYAGKKLSVVDKVTGEITEMDVFVAILPASNYTYVEASRSQKLPDFIASMNSALHFFSGAPRSIVTDNLKSAVTKSSKYEPVLNKTLKDLGLHYSSVINPTRSYAPQDKALVENAVKLAYQRIYYPMNKMLFFSLEDLNKEIAIHLKVFNKQLMKSYQTSREQLFLDREKASLSPLPSQPYQIRTFKKATVQKMGYVFLSESKNYYSVPYRYISKQVELQYNTDTVEIYHKSERIAIHKREHYPGKYITTESHLSSSHRFYNDWSPEYFYKLGCNIGSHTAEYIKALIDSKAYPEVAYKQSLGIIHLKKIFDVSRLEKACQMALSYNTYSYITIKRILENKMDKEDTYMSELIEIPEHQNIRGGSYYQ